LYRVAVVILNWNGKTFLERFLPILIDRTKNAEIIVADNASTDGSKKFMRTNFPHIRLIEHTQNYGFAGGYNLALEQIDSEYYVLLNSDIEVADSWLLPLLAEMDSDKSIAACQPKILDYYKRTQFEYAGASGGFIDKLGYPFCRGRIFNTYEIDMGQYDNSTDIFWATGACLMVRASVFHKIGGLDNDFFAHMEEIDFCWRLNNNGYRVRVVPQSIVYHIGGGTLPKSSSRKTYLNFRNNYILLYKNLPPNRLILLLLFRLWIDWLAAFKFLTDGNIDDCIAVFKAQVHSYFSFSKHRYKRLQQPFFSRKNIYKGIIIIEYYIQQRKTFSSIKKTFFD
jgi:GT2 family glycosyltransferase